MDATQDATASGDRCAVANGGCSAQASCSAANGVATCTCHFGWTGDGASCTNNGPTCDGSPGSCVAFAPTGSVEAADLDGDGLLPFVLPAISPDVGYDADAGSSGITVINVDTGLIASDGAILRPARTGDPSVRDVQSGIAYRQTSSNIAVVTFRSLIVPVGATLRFVGARAVAIASATTMRIDGIVDIRPASSDGTTVCPGTSAPGGFLGGAPGSYSYGSHGGSQSPARPGAGPGAGVGGTGAGSGAGHANQGGASCAGACNDGGVSYDLALLDTADFHGGSGGGGGCGASPFCNATNTGGTGGGGGAGGGAIRLVAASSIEIGGGSTVGGVNAGGCGGGRAQDSTNDAGSQFCCGGGGGSGGAIVIEAPRVQLDSRAALNASGGGGGSYDRSGDSPTLGAVAEGCFVPLYMRQTDTAGNGGGASEAAGMPGEAPTCAGGGAAGWIRINAGSGNAVINPGAFLSPNQQSGATTVGATAVR
jgi:hypothetical protein